MDAAAPGCPSGIRVLFVCTANISRSPYLELRARDLVSRGAGPSEAQFSSAGTYAAPGRSIDPQMRTELSTRGIDAGDHASRQVSAAMARAADVVLTAESAHRTWLLTEDPALVRRVFTLDQVVENLSTVGEGLTLRDLLHDNDQLAALRRPVEGEILDPYGKSLEVAAQAALRMDELLVTMLSRL